MCIRDSYQASLTAMNHLMSLGHTRIGYIGETRDEDRYTGYCTALNTGGIPLKKEYVADVPLSSEGGYRGEMCIRDSRKPLLCHDSRLKARFHRLHVLLYIIDSQYHITAAGNRQRDVYKRQALYLGDWSRRVADQHIADVQHMASEVRHGSRSR